MVWPDSCIWILSPWNLLEYAPGVNGSALLEWDEEAYFPGISTPNTWITTHFEKPSFTNISPLLEDGNKEIRLNKKALAKNKNAIENPCCNITNHELMDLLNCAFQIYHKAFSLLQCFEQRTFWIIRWNVCQIVSKFFHVTTVHEKIRLETEKNVNTVMSEQCSGEHCSDIITLLFEQVKNKHGMKSVQIRSFFWSVFSCIWTEYRKIRIRKSSVFGYFSCITQWKFETEGEYWEEMREES